MWENGYIGQRESRIVERGTVTRRCPKQDCAQEHKGVHGVCLFNIFLDPSHPALHLQPSTALCPLSTADPLFFSFEIIPVD